MALSRGGEHLREFFDALDLMTQLTFGVKVLANGLPPSEGVDLHGGEGERGGGKGRGKGAEGGRGREGEEVEEEERHNNSVGKASRN